MTEDMNAKDYKSYSEKDENKRVEVDAILSDMFRVPEPRIISSANVKGFQSEASGGDGLYSTNETTRESAPAVSQEVDICVRDLLETIDHLSLTLPHIPPVVNRSLPAEPTTVADLFAVCERSRCVTLSKAGVSDVSECVQSDHKPWSVSELGESKTLNTLLSYDDGSFEESSQTPSATSESEVYNDERAALQVTEVLSLPIHFINGTQATTTTPQDLTSEACLAARLVDTEQQSDDTRPRAWEVDLTDWSKKTTQRPARGLPRKVSSLEERKKEEHVSPINEATPQAMAERKVLDLRRWYCISRPQYKTSCGISSVISCWNYLFSTLGVGTQKPITQEEALRVLGFHPPFEEIKFGPFTGNKTLMRWFRQLNIHYRVRGRCYFLFKPNGRNKTYGVSSEQALQSMKRGLHGRDMTFIYHCQNHYFCPIGYEDVPLKASDAYKTGLSQEEVETWILIGDPSRRHPGIHFKRWEDIETDLNCQNPDYMDIRRLWKGMMKRKTKKVGGNLHCLMAFRRSPTPGQKTRPRKSQAGGDAFNIDSPVVLSPRDGSQDIDSETEEETIEEDSD